MDNRSSVSLNICIVGAAGSGKSTFVNTLRDLRPTDDGAATPGVIGTKAEPKEYQHPKNPNVTFWVLPGYGTSEVPRSILEQIDLQKYQLYIVVSAYRFTEDDLLLATKLERAAKRFYFIRTRIDVDVRHEQEDYPDEYSESAVLARIRKNCTKELSKGGIHDPNVFLVGKNRQLYDFPLLEANLYADQHGLPDKPSDFPDDIYKTGSFTQDKTQLLQRWLRLDAARCVIFGSKLVPKLLIFVNLEKVREVLAFYKKQYKLDDVGLEKFSSLADVSKDVLLESVKDNFWWEFSDETLLNEMECDLDEILGSKRPFRVLGIPVIGFIAKYQISYTTTSKFLLRTMVDMKNASETIVNAVRTKIATKKWYQ